VIARRLLVNYRVAPDVLASVLPAPFRPQLVNGWGVAGICLIGLRAVRPRGLPAIVGLASENAAHRIAVEWEADGTTQCGVYVPRRDTNAWFNVALGGRMFPGVHHRAEFSVRDTDGTVSVALESEDGETRVRVVGRAASHLPADSVFRSIDDASGFFERGSLGYSASRRAGSYDALELRTQEWHVAPLAVEHVTSTFFENAAVFPAGSTTFDCALIMRNVAHEWHARDVMQT
jgi:hypothetical protein